MYDRNAKLGFKEGMVRRLTMAQETLVSDLRQRSIEAMFDAQFPENGSFVRRTANGRDYYYYVGYVKAADGGAAGRQYSKYVGPADDSAVVAQVEGFGTIKASHRERREIVRALRGAGLSTPPRFVGEVVEALWKSGVFRLRGVLVGTAAFQTYETSMGVRFPTAPTMTGDVDIAQFRSISVAVDDATEPLLDSLRGIDPSFVPVPHQTHRSRVVSFRNAKDFRVEFLAPHQGAAEEAREPFRMPSLDGAAAQPLRYLDYLIHKPERSVLLHGGGVPVLVPRPDRYCVHKLVVSQRRAPQSADKARKDVEQASILIEVAQETKVLVDFGHAWLDAWAIGPKTRRRLVRAEAFLKPAVASLLAQARTEALAEVGGDPDDLSSKIANLRAPGRPAPPGAEVGQGAPDGLDS